MKTWWMTLVVGVCALQGMGQTLNPDSAAKELAPIVISDTSLLATARDSLLKPKVKKWMPDPKRATRLALIPGGGQIYNRDYWKVGLVYAALGGGTWTALYWHKRYVNMKDWYFKFYDPNKNYQLISNSPDYKVVGTYIGGVLNGATIDSLELTRDQVNRLKNTYRRYKGLAVIATGLIYSLSIIEANVAAHMKTFDLTDDLTLRVEPRVYQPMMPQPTAQLRLVFNFK